MALIVFNLVLIEIFVLMFNGEHLSRARSAVYGRKESKFMALCKLSGSAQRFCETTLVTDTLKVT